MASGGPGGRFSGVGPLPERSFADLLSSYRGAAGLTQEELAERASLSVGAISLLERGARTAPRPQTVACLATALALAPADRRDFTAAARRRPAVSVPQPGRTASPELWMRSTSFLGREPELARVRLLLREPGVRFLTLTGPPGAGKTRLAVEVAAAVAPDYRDGVVAVELAPLTDPTQVVPAIRQALGLAEARNRSALETVVSYCHDRHVLLLLDNVEQLVAVGPELARLLERCPGLQMLVTSRTAVRIRAEREFTVPALALPSLAAERAGAPDAVRSTPAVALFLDRAIAARPGFELTAANATEVAAICRRLGGLPLALELAAPWVRLLTPSEILGQLDRQLELLVGGSRDLPVRQRSMRATLAWSCDLLDAEAIALLRRLSVFRGGAPLDALADVAALPGGVMPHLATLVDHGLVTRPEAAAGEPRVVLLETVREYGTELLAAAGEQTTTALAHLAYYTGLALRFDREVRTAAQAAWLARIRRERDNVRAALDRAVDYGHPEQGLRLAAAMTQFWELDGCREEGLSWLDRLLAATVDPEPAVLAEARRATGFLRWRTGSHERAAADLRAGLAIFEQLGDRRGIAEATRGLGNALGAQGHVAEAIRLLEAATVLLRDLGEHERLAAALTSIGMYTSRGGDRTRATALYQEALDIYRALDDVLGTAMCLTNLGHQAQLAGDPHLARTRLEAAVAAGRRLNAPFHLAAALANLADVFREQDDVDAACLGYREALELFATTADQSGVASCLRCVAWGAWREGEPARAARLYGAAEAISPVAVSYDVDDAGLHERVRAELRALLGAAAFAAAYEAGGRLSLSEAAAEGAR